MNKEYQAGISALSAALNEEQKRVLSEIESLNAENMKHALRDGFMNGVYDRFQQFFAVR